MVETENAVRFTFHYALIGIPGDSRDLVSRMHHRHTRALPLKMADGDYVIGDDVKRL